MKPEDVAVWERFIVAQPRFFDTVDYDFRVGQGRPIAPEMPENIKRSALALTQRKIDAVGYIGEAIYLVEVKPTADTRALGQIEMYHDLFTAQHEGDEQIIKMVLASDIEPDLLETYRNRDVLLVTV